MYMYKLNLWDFSGHPEFYEIRCKNYKETDIVILVFDTTIRKSLDELDVWSREIK